MLIAACYGQSEPEYATANSLVAAFRNLGHTVIRVGSYYHGWPGTPGCDVVLEDRPFPELYSYDEIINEIDKKVPNLKLGNEKWSYDEIIAKTEQVDLFLQIEPHFYFHGEKPKGVKSAYYFTDPHRGGWTYYNLAKEGSFDAVFCGQPAFVNLFRGLNVHALPPAFDNRRKVDYIDKTECDISFCGQTGFANVVYDRQDEYGWYATKLPDWRDRRNFQFAAPGWDYAERAAMLSLLSQDFDLRVYKGGLVGDNYMRAIQAGKIGFNRSLLGDIGIRCYEVMAAGRMLVTDEIEGLSASFGHGRFAQYDTFFKPFFDNFLLEYQQVVRLVEFILKYDDWLSEGKIAYRETFKQNLWEHRAEKMLQLLVKS